MVWVYSVYVRNRWIGAVVCEPGRLPFSCHALLGLYCYMTPVSQLWLPGVGCVSMAV